MGTGQKLAEKLRAGLQAAHPQFRKTVINKLALAVGAMIEAQTPNTSELANVVPVPTERQEIREQWLRRLLKNPRVESPVILEPFARVVLAEAASNGQTILLSLDQTALGECFAVLMLAVQIPSWRLFGKCPFRVKGLARLEDPVSQCQEFTHGGADNDLTWFTLGFKPFAKSPEKRVMLAGDDRREVEGFAEPSLATFREPRL